MTRNDAKLIAKAIANVEAIIETTDVDGIGSSTLRLVVDQIGGEIKALYPRFNTGAFQIEALPIQSERQKQVILRALGMSQEEGA